MVYFFTCDVTMLRLRLETVQRLQSLHTYQLNLLSSELEFSDDVEGIH